jgi:hypothetical protein
MQNSDGVENTYQFPQIRGCTTEPKCEELVEFQYDTYWIRDKADEDYLAGLNVLNSSADDAQLEPHDYYSVVKRGAENCPTEPTATATVSCDLVQGTVTADDDVVSTIIVEMNANPGTDQAKKSVKAGNNELSMVPLQDGVRRTGYISVDLPGTKNDLYQAIDQTCGAPTPPPPPCDDVCHLPVFPHSQGNVVCNGALVGGTYRNVTVKRGDTCVLADVKVNGSVHANGARNLLVHDATIRGNVVARHVSGDVYLGSKQSCKYDPVVGGSVVVKHSHNVLICDMTVCKKVVLKHNDGKITVRSSTARKIVVKYNRQFVRDRGDSTHRGLSTIRLIHVHGRVVAKHNAPRQVLRR